MKVVNVVKSASGLNATCDFGVLLGIYILGNFQEMTLPLRHFGPKFGQPRDPLSEFTFSFSMAKRRQNALAIGGTFCPNKKYNFQKQSVRIINDLENNLFEIDLARSVSNGRKPLI